MAKNGTPAKGGRKSLTEDTKMCNDLLKQLALSEEKMSSIQEELKSCQANLLAEQKKSAKLERDLNTVKEKYERLVATENKDIQRLEALTQEKEADIAKLQDQLGKQLDLIKTLNDEAKTKTTEEKKDDESKGFQGSNRIHPYRQGQGNRSGYQRPNTSLFARQDNVEKKFDELKESLESSVRSIAMSASQASLAQNVAQNTVLGAPSGAAGAPAGVLPGTVPGVVPGVLPGTGAFAFPGALAGNLPGYNPLGFPHPYGYNRFF